MVSLVSDTLALIVKEAVGSIPGSESLHAYMITTIISMIKFNVFIAIGI